MGAAISNIALVTYVIISDSIRAIYNFFATLMTNNEVPLIRRRLSLRNADQNFSVTAKWGTIQVVGCEEGTECKLYIHIYNNRRVKLIDATIYQDSIVSLESEIEILWTDPRTGNSDGVTFNYPVDAKAVMEMFL